MLVVLSGSFMTTQYKILTPINVYGDVKGIPCRKSYNCLAHVDIT